MASAKLAKIGEDHREPQPKGNREDETGGGLPLAGGGLQPKAGRQDAAHVNREHDRVLDHMQGRQLFKGFQDRPAGDVWVE
jgi:hypothetical protein